MEDGMSIEKLTIGASVFTALGYALKAWIQARYGRTEIRPQPLAVQQTHPPTSPELCDERHELLRDQVKDLYIRINMVELAVGELKALKEQVKSMDGKLDTIIKNLK